MKSHADFFRGQLAATLGNERIGSIKLAEWANSSSASLSAPISKGYPLILQSLTPLKPLFSFEASRFASAALESYSTTKLKWKDPEDREGLAWRLVGLYYAAYYSAHAILRFTGVSITQIESWKNIESQFQTLYSSPQQTTLGLDTGYHALTVDSSGTSLSVMKLKIDSGHGSHVALWREFKGLADSCYANNSLNTSQQRAAVAAYTGQLNLSLMVNGIKCSWPWMPAMRNHINYQLPDLVWGPNTKRIKPSENKQIHQLIVSPTELQITEGASVTSSVYLRFSASCVYIISLLCHLLRDMEIRAASKQLLPVIFRDRSTIIDKVCGA